MKQPDFDVNTDRLRAYVQMFDVPVPDNEIEAHAELLAGGLAGLAGRRRGKACRRGGVRKVSFR